MFLKDPRTGALLNINNFKMMNPIDQPKFQTKIVLDIEGGGYFEAATTTHIIIEAMKEKRFFMECEWNQKWS